MVALGSFRVGAQEVQLCAVGENDRVALELHKRLVEGGCATGDGSLHGEMWTTSPQDIVKMLQESQSFLFLGFGRFFTTMPAKVLASQTLGHLPLMALFSRAINDAAFRRQTKVDSMKSQRQLLVENVYESALLCAFRRPHVQN